MILVDTGPFVALFNAADSEHQRSLEKLKLIDEPLMTTVPVLTEAFHILEPDSAGAYQLREFVIQGGTSLWFFNYKNLTRAFELMEKYSDHPMDLADASLVTAAETLGTKKIFTIDRNDFTTYKAKIGHRYTHFEMI